MGGDCVVVVSIFIAAPIVYVSWRCLCCRFTVNCCSHFVCRLSIVLGVDFVVVSLLIAAPIVSVGYAFYWAVIVLLFRCLLLLPLCV